MESFWDVLKSVGPTDVLKIQAWSSIGTLVFTGIMTLYAKKALYSWREQKNFDIKMELLSNMGNAINQLNKVNRIIFPTDNLQDFQTIILAEIQQFNDQEFYNTYQEYCRFFNHYFSIYDEVVELRKVAMKSKRTPADTKIKRFYHLWLIFEAEIYNIQYNFFYFNLNILSERHNYASAKMAGSPLQIVGFDKLLEDGNSPEKAINTLYNSLQNLNKLDSYKELLSIYQEMYFFE